MIPEIPITQFRPIKLQEIKLIEKNKPVHVSNSL